MRLDDEQTPTDVTSSYRHINGVFKSKLNSALVKCVLSWSQHIVGHFCVSAPSAHLWTEMSYMLS